MQLGGHLAQFAPPDEILASPASDFVARFVGADRGLKRLSLTKVRDLELQPVATVRDGEPVEEARRRAADAGFGYLLVVDDAGRPAGWLDAARLSGDRVRGAEASSVGPLVEPETTVKDALSMLLANEVQAGIVTDRDGKPLGLITVESIGVALRPPAAAPAAPAR
jgi:osmoprotectant transport system ATP-binding protein